MGGKSLVRDAVASVGAVTAALLVMAQGLSAQQVGVVTGRVTDGQSGQPIAAGQVFIADLDIGVLTQPNGRYLIPNVPAGTHTVAAERIGYRRSSQEVTVAAGATVVHDFIMVEEALRLNEIVVTGTPGGTQRRAIGNVVGQLDASTIAETAPITNVRNLIGTREPGASVLGGAGQVGAGSVIRIRGASSLSLDNGPIVYVDGVRVDAGMRGAGGFASASGSRLDDFSPEDIESIEIIKGPAAATLYGTEAANGVIQIITKRGAEGEVSFDLAVRQGVNWFPNPRRYFGNKWFRDPATDELVSTYLYDQENELQGRNYVQDGRNQYYHMGASGGTANFRFAASLDTDFEDGVFPDHPNSNDRYAGRLNLDFLKGEDFNVNVSSVYAQRTHENNEPGAGLGPMGNMFFGTHPLHAPQRRGFYVQKPEDIANIFTTTENRRFTGSATLNHNPFPWLAHRLTAGIDRSEETITTIFPRHPLGAAGPLGGRSLGERSDNWLTLTNYTVDYSASVTLPVTSAIESRTSFGVQYYNKRESSAGATGYVFPAPVLTTLGATTGPPNINGDYVENRTVGAYIEQRIGFNDNLFVTGAVRADDNSAFGAEYDLAIYPKVSATWTVEDPLAVAPWLDLVRLRGAFGAAGQQPDVFAAVRLYNPSSGPGGSAAITPGEAGNPDLEPERSEEVELGFDATVLENRVDVQFTYYNRTTKDAIISRELAPSAGFPGNQWINAGQVSNWGTELGINAQVIRPGGPIAWNLGLAFATMHSKLDRLGLEGTTELSAGGRGIRHVEGFPLASAFEWEIVSADWDGSGGVTNVMCLGPGSLGSVRPEDATPVPRSEGCAFIYQGGPSDPTWEFSGSSDFTLFQDWRLAGTFVGRGGHVKFSRNLGPTIECCPWSRLEWADDDPVVRAMGNIRRQGVGHYDAGFIRLQELSLSYAVPEAWAARVGASTASVSLQMSNVWQIWRASWYSQVVEDRNLQGDNRESFYVAEPDIRNTGNFDGTNYVQQPSKTFLASVRLTF